MSTQPVSNRAPAALNSRLLIAAALACGLFAHSTAATAQDETTTATAQTTTASQILPEVATPVDVADDEPTTASYTAVLLGEAVADNPNNTEKGPFPDLAGMTTSTLAGKVIDLTAHGVTIAQTAEKLPQALEASPDIVIIFNGYTDGANETPDEDQRATLQAMTTELQKAGARVFLVPASLNIDAMPMANLRLAASETNATFISLGLESGGQPYQDALLEIAAELEAQPDDAVATAPAPTPASNIVTIQGRTVKAATPISEPATAPRLETVTVPEGSEAPKRTELKASLDRELGRIASQTDEELDATGATTTATAQEDLPTTGKIYVDTGTSMTYAAGEIPEGGQVTRRGRDAQDSISMKPLPPLKAYRPAPPVNRTRTDIKEPGFSR